MSATHIISREEVMEYLDGELAPPRAMFVRAHVDGCDECRGAAEALRSLSRALGDWHVEPAPLTLVAPRDATLTAPALAAKPALGARVRSLPWRVAPWLAAAAAVVLIVWVASPRLPLRSLSAGDRIDSATPSSAPARPVDSLGYVSRNGGQRRDEPGQALQKAPEKDVADAIHVQTGGGDNSVQWNREGGNITDMTALKLEPVAGAASVKQAADPRLLVRTAFLSISTDRFDDVQARLERVAAARSGTVSGYQLSGSRDTERSLSATLRVPVAVLDAAMADLRTVGTVTSESQQTEEVTDAHRDLAIRIDNAKREAGRLNELLARQSDRLSDVLEVEQAQARVQTNIEQMTAEETAMRGRAALSTITLQVHEQRRAQIAIGPQPFAVRLRNAAVDGMQAAIDLVLAVAVIAIGLAPSVLLWMVLGGPVAWLVWRVTSARRARAAHSHNPPGRV